MVGASIEATLELWAASLRNVKGRIRPLFLQERVAASAGQFLDGLLGNEPRKTGWMRAEAAGDPGPWRQQAILGRGRWDADALRDIVREYALETLADEEAVLVIDETGFLKQGKASCGVARQYTGSAGKITNCQIGVFACYVSRHGHAFIDRALYLPKEWTDDPKRLKAAHVPEDQSFASKPQIARRMMARAIAAKVPFSFVAADSVYGTGDIETMLRKAGKSLPPDLIRGVMFWALPPTTCSIPGARGNLLAAVPRSSRKAFPRAPGGACRQAKEPKVRACTTGPISNWPISMPANTTAPSLASGRGVS
jgi:SRSO17 transposase